MRLHAYILILLLVANPTQATLRPALSEVFQLDTRSTTASTFSSALSQSFSIDTADKLHSAPASSSLFTSNTFPAYGAMGESSAAPSSVFLLDTGTILQSNLNVVSDGDPIPGSKIALGLFSGSSDLSEEATYAFVGEIPSWAGIGGSTLFILSNATAGDSVDIVGIYRNAEGQEMSFPFTVTVVSPLHITGTASAEPMGAGIYAVSLRSTAKGGTPPYTYRWETDGDDDFADHLGQDVNFQSSNPDGGTKPVIVEVTDASGEKDTFSMPLTMDRPLEANQPERLVSVPDPYIGRFVDRFGEPFEFDLSRRNNGLVVLAHGLYSNAEPSDENEPWILDMANRIHSRLEAQQIGSAPNIAIMDWRDYADPGGEIDPEKLKALERLEAVYSIYKLQQNIGEETVQSVGQELRKEDALRFLDIDFNFTTLAARALDGAVDLAYIRPFGADVGDSLAAWMLDQKRVGLINPDAPIHLIGHSAGGFVCGQASLQLKLLHAKGIDSLTVDRVTMLDTPMIYSSHIFEGPGPTIVESITSSIYGSLQTKNFVPILSQRNPNLKVGHLGLRSAFRWCIGEAGHGLAHVWYRRTIQKADEGNGKKLDGYQLPGFEQSPFVTGKLVERLSPVAFAKKSRLATKSSRQDPCFETFGEVDFSEGVYTIRESNDAGIWKQIDLSQRAESLAFDFQFSSPSDGDFLHVMIGESDTVMLASNLSIYRNGFASISLPLTSYEGSFQRILLTLVSRGQANASLQIKNLRIVEGDDLDFDGLTFIDELEFGTNPALADTDADGISDKEEIFDFFTNPLLADTDSDGQTDFDELKAGTSPTDSRSVLRANISQLQSGQFMLRWPTVGRRFYQLQRSNSLNFQTFEALGTFDNGIEIEDSAIIDEIRPPERAFFRIEAIPK